MTIAARAAPEIDRLAISVNRQVGPKHGDRLREMAKEIGLDSLEMLPHFEGFLLAGTLTEDVATLRMRYWPADRVRGRLAELSDKGLIEPGDTGLGATATLRPLLVASLAARAEVAAGAWGGHDDAVATVARHARQVMDGTSDDHIVAVVHRDLPEPDDRYLLLEHRLFGLRYIRQHDHAAAWLVRGLTAAQMVVMTALWNGHDPGTDLAGLVEAGHASADPARLTTEGHVVRDAIEAETNVRAQQSYDVLDANDANELLAALRSLPGTVD